VRSATDHPITLNRLLDFDLLLAHGRLDSLAGRLVDRPVGWATFYRMMFYVHLLARQRYVDRALLTEIV
jgi:hypothetical protein